MAPYLVRFTYNSAAWKGLIKEPMDRREMIATRIFGTFGGRLEGFWHCFGDHDGYALVELPSTVAAAAARAVSAATGLYRELEMTPLISVDEMVDAWQQAAAFPNMIPDDWELEAS